uniref:Small integral membrane protein 19 n=1 Tax=Taeniopygia guttata TaxID=59729 RepID=A0A674HKT1_TAEGU
MAAVVGAGAAGAGGGASAALGDGGAIDYSVHEAWNEATNVYLLVVLASLALLVYARRNKRRILRIFTLPPAAETPPEPNFYDSFYMVTETSPCVAEIGFSDATSVSLLLS